MARHDAPAAPAWQIAAMIGLFAAGAAFSIWLAASQWLSLRDGLAAERTVILVNPTAAVGVPLGIAFLCLIALPLLPKAVPPRTRSGFVRTTRLWDATFLTVIACIPLTFVATPIAWYVVDDAMTTRGYRVCPLPHRPRGPTRWVRTDTPCPDDQDASPAK